MKILFAIHDWGLGHATRDLILIKALLEAEHGVTILSAGRALQLLRQELDRRCDFIELRDIPKPLSRHAAWFYINMSLSLPIVFQTFWREHKVVEQLCQERKYDRVISDSRYGVWASKVPSYYLVHSLRQIIPGRPRRLEQLVEYSQKRLLRKADKILIPDQLDDGLAGDLCHDLSCDWENCLEYIGILSSVARTNVETDIDYFISISGAEPQRSIFEKIILNQVHELSGKIVIALGKPEDSTAIRETVFENGRIAIHNCLNRAQQQEMLNRARLVISRSGYTTMMELAELGKKALLIPTVGQSEQEYLADYHERLGHIHTVRQADLDLARDVAVAEKLPGLPSVRPTQNSVSRFLSVVGC